MSADKFDLIIIGGGTAAFAAAIKAEELGVKTAMISDGPLGGTCVNVGCVPSKHLLAVGDNVFYPKRPLFKAVGKAQPQFDFKAAIEEKDEIVGRLQEENYKNVLGKMEKVIFYKGKGKFVSKNEVKVNDKLFKSDKFIIATGAKTLITPLEGIGEIDYLTNIEALSLTEIPESMIVIGGRSLGLEFAQMYAHFGTQVTILQRSQRILPNEEPEISEALKKYLEEEGIIIHTGVEVKNIKKEDKYKIVTAQVGGGHRKIKGERLLMATGMSPNTKYLELEKAEVEVDERGFVKVNEQMRTTAPHIWAAGDVAGGLLLETVAAKEGAFAAANALEDAKKTINYQTVPHAVFTSPQVASVGLTEAELTEMLGVCSCRTVPMNRVPKARVVKDIRGLVKMVINPKNFKIAGVHILAPLGADMIHEATLAVKFGLTVDDIIDTVHVFPTFSEAIKLAAQSFRRDISKMSCCVE